MIGLNFESFFFDNNDFEYNQYLILAGIKIYRNEYKLNKIYPGLNELIKVNTTLEDLIKHQKLFHSSEPPKYKNFEVLKRLDEKSETIISDSFFFDMVNWSLPFIKEAIEEGIALFEYVEKNIKIVPVGSSHIKRDAGYMLIPDNLGHKMHVHRYELSTSKEQKFLSAGLKTMHVHLTESAETFNSPEHIWKYLNNIYKNMSSPTTYVCETDLEFPYGESLFPVAKRKLMEKVTS